MAANPVKPIHQIGLKVERTYPRCHKRLYHTVWGQHKIKCANCGDVWRGRLTNAETQDEEQAGATPEKARIL